jgi:uncharacterized phage-associated protein
MKQSVVRLKALFGAWRRGSTTMTETASNIAKYILCHFRAKGDPIDNLKLQKLLYYTQAWYLAINGIPLFSDQIEAWVHGPVVPSVFREYRAYRWSPITADVSYQPDSGTANHIDVVLVAYGEYSAWDLEKLSHSEEPWKQARAGIPPDQSSRSIITHESMRAFYQ